MRAGRRKHPFPSGPIQQNSVEQAGNKAVVVSWALGELGGEFLFLKERLGGVVYSCFIFSFCGFGVFFLCYPKMSMKPGLFPEKGLTQTN